jgi:hypothetical protein
MQNNEYSVYIKIGAKTPNTNIEKENILQKGYVIFKKIFSFSKLLLGVLTLILT